MADYERLPYQFAAILLAFGVMLAIARRHGNRRKDKHHASQRANADSAAGIGQAQDTIASASGGCGSRTD